jgi:DNA-binding response OmpR family regulator
VCSIHLTMEDQIFCLEDDQSMQDAVRASLPEYKVTCVGTIAEAEKILQKPEQFQALLIDIHLPDGDGLRFLTDLVNDERFKKMPILILSGRTDISNKVMAFTYGAEDFVAKPFDPIELHARVASKIRLRHNGANAAMKRILGDVVLDFSRQKAFRWLNGNEVDLNLTHREINILSLLTRRLEQIYSRDQIMAHVWGESYVSDRTIDSHIAHLRHKIEGAKLKLETAKNFGYSARVMN